jgi:hypothetical protein
MELVEAYLEKRALIHVLQKVPVGFRDCTIKSENSLKIKAYMRTLSVQMERGEAEPIYRLGSAVPMLLRHAEPSRTARLQLCFDNNNQFEAFYQLYIGYETVQIEGEYIFNGRITRIDFSPEYLTDMYSKLVVQIDMSLKSYRITT